MGYNPTEGKCNLCVNNVNLTDKELTFLNPIFQNLQIENKRITGACIRPVIDPTLLVRRYVKENDSGCVFFSKGFYEEQLNIQCPDCTEGKLVIKRPIIRSQPRIFFACNRYPDCTYTTYKVQLKTKCRKCNTLLELHNGEILKVVCPICQNPFEIPISQRIWPALAKPEGGCVHFDAIESCVYCDNSRQVKKSLIDLEWPTLSKYTLAQSLNNQRIIDHQIDDNGTSTGPGFDIIAYATDGKYNRNHTNGVKINDPFALNHDEILEMIEDRSDYAEYYNDLCEEYGDGD